MSKINIQNYSAMTQAERKKNSSICWHATFKVLSAAIIGFLILYALLNFFSNGLLYLAFGNLYLEKISWKWLKFKI